ncbi:PatA/PatG family cyanobactin maturation protease [Aquibium microcysteis]|uniref:PatA/PatG family cyanobactin maturation protease n=1 Tax=Aquibium microcysteis TaxID=675281 RepID=UPI00165CF246|nr:PatA/PatG family cyanobactin maturation protease [Aquibium microcysteis]
MPTEPIETGAVRRITVAVLDGPVDLGHPCFSGASIELPHGQPAPDPASPATRHGTHVASLLFGQPGSEVEGLAAHCRGLVIPIFQDRGGRLAASQLDLARAILAAVENGADFINISGGQLSPSGAPEPFLADAIARCATRNVLIVAAAGNDGCECLHVPAAAPGVLAVGAMDETGTPLPSSNWGALYGRQGLLAPGKDIMGALAGGGTASRSGTSYAAPHVTGHAARLAALQVGAGRAPDPHGIAGALLATAAPCPDQAQEGCARFLAGRIDVIAATAKVQGGLVMSEYLEQPSPDPIVRADQAAPFLSVRGAAGGEPRASIHPPQGDGSTIPTGTRAARSGADPVRSVLAAGIEPSDCGCGCGGKGKSEAGCGCGGSGGPAKPQLVYALGRIGYDFGSEARRDSIAQAMGGNPMAAEPWLGYLDGAPYEAPSAIWTLSLDATPIYAVQPAGPYAEKGYEMLRDALAAQEREGADLVSVPGLIAGTRTLESGQVVPLIVPALRGIYCWKPAALVQSVLGARPQAAAEQETYDRFSSGLGNFLSRVYYDLRNLGVTGEERALNYSATNAVQIAAVIENTTRQSLDLDTIMVKKSPVCRPDSDCYDVEIAFFNPDNTNVASRIYRFTVDVSDVVPVTIGTVRSWTRRV